MSAKSKYAIPSSDSTDRSPPSVASNPTVENPSPKLITAADATQLQAELKLAKEGLKKANKKLVLLEKENAKALSKVERVKKAHKWSKEEANERLRNALEAQKRAKEESNFEESRAIELEQAAIEASERKEEEWQKKLEQVKNEHILDLAAMKKIGKENERSLKNEKVDLLECFRRLNQELLESENRLNLAKEENFEVVKKYELLKSEIKIIKEEKTKLVDELETSRNEEDKKRKKALENLASALHEVSSKAIFSSKVKNEKYKMQIEDLKAKNEKSERMLDDAKQGINGLSNYIERSKAEVRKKELNLTSTLKRSEEEKSCMEFEIIRLVNLLKKVEKEACEKEASFEEANLEATRLKKVASEVKAESARLRESLVDRENELKKNVSENDELRKREMALLVQVEVLSNLLEEALAEKNKREEENGELTDSSEKDYDVLPKWTSFMKINEKHVDFYEVENLKNWEEKEEGNEDCFSELDMEMWESFKIDEKDSYTESDDATNGVMKKKKMKKPMLGKIGSLLKKG